ncbi:unnamed protein product [Miscanthus lutarioriparius]|uniref:Protein EARLY FLOWERING 4 domain-containing protein n=1 Tax=Miscanthus lutarioriparius TaxID=422564 RepID=A0A811ND50_9POAL|nr:unnamed protein product [Miscanthus lutarioriparius]
MVKSRHTEKKSPWTAHGRIHMDGQIIRGAGTGGAPTDRRERSRRFPPKIVRFSGKNPNAERTEEGSRRHVVGNAPPVPSPLPRPGHSIGSSIAGSSETGSMEEDGGSGSGSGSREPFVAGAGAGTGASSGAGSNRGVGAGTSAGGGAKLPQVLQKSFGEVQGILEHNRVLIQEISQNQETRDADGLTRNVALIRELNTNIARVVDLYGDMSGSFARAVAAKKAAGGDKGGPKRPRSAGAGGQQQ